MTGIVINKLCKRYGKEKEFALKDLSLSVKPGEVYGFLGANGAGKSTTIRLLLNFIQPSSGHATIKGLDFVKDSVKVKNYIGYLSGDVALWPKVTGHQLFDYLAKLQKKDCRSYLKELIQRFEAEPDKRIDELSKGNRQKIGIIQALMHQPEVLILDEPTSGLDPLMQEVFYDVIREASKRGSAVFVSSHNLTEVQHMCDRIGIIKHGKLIHEQNILDTNAGNLSQPVFKIVVAHAEDVSKLRSFDNLKIVNVLGNNVTLQPRHNLSRALGDMAKIEINTINTESASLESEFLEYYGDEE